MIKITIKIKVIWKENNNKKTSIKLIKEIKPNPKKKDKLWLKINIANLNSQSNK